MTKLHDRAAWIHGGPVRCVQPPARTNQPCRLVLLGPPGSGKSTQAELLGERVGVCHLAVADIFQSGKRHGHAESDAALETARHHAKWGKTVPDEIAASIIGQRAHCLRCLGGAVLDGFPQTVGQARSLDQILQSENVSLTAVIHYELPAHRIVARLAGRRVCPMCKSVFHLKDRPPRLRDFCDHCGFKLYPREDDRPGLIRARVRAYAQTVIPLLDYYRKRGLLIAIDADARANKVCDRTVAALAKREPITCCA